MGQARDGRGGASRKGFAYALPLGFRPVAAPALEKAAMTSRPLALAAAALALAAGPAAAERVSFKSADGTEIGGELFLPAGRGPHPAVVMLHGCSGYRLRRSGEITPIYTFWSRFAVERGFAALIVDSFGPRGIDEICARRDRPLTDRDERRGDALGAFAYLAQRPDIRRDRLLLMGWSHGAMTTLHTLDARRADAPRAAPPMRAALVFYPGCAAFARSGLAPLAPLTVLIGAADDWTRPGPCKDMEARAAGRTPPIRVVVYPEAYHSFDHPNLPVRTRIARNSAWKEPERTVHLGTNPAARAAAIQEVEAFLAPWRR